MTEETFDPTKIALPARIRCIRKRGFWAGQIAIREGDQFDAMGVEELGPSNWAFQVEGLGGMLRLLPMECFEVIHDYQPESAPAPERYSGNSLFGRF